MAHPPKSDSPQRDPSDDLVPVVAPSQEARSSLSPTESAEPPALTPDLPETFADAEIDEDVADLPTSFDTFDLSPALRQALTDMGWTEPTPVQVKTFDPIVQGRDVLVQSQTGTGKTGAFCLPWLAARFQAGPARDTGVQLLVLVPTRELAKQVCEQLVSLAHDSALVPLPVYGGTAMQPQLSALKAGVHAVVGTPGRILDHIRRRTLDLSRVQMVVLDEADEMLSMGFLEDIHAILDACPQKRQTTLFSATVPPDIERIARRYMHHPVPIKLSGDQVAAAQIDHAYYQVGGSIRTRDLLDVIAHEEPATALIFCNTREETNIAANVLRREGYSAEALSSDLTQTSRERVLGWMRSGRLRFLVATDVASRGIDISHISHVINFTFPENAESYIHRTGRTGRAGRPGQALSLIAPQELGNFYYLKLQYQELAFEERKLPPPEELEAVRIENKLDLISKRFPDLVSPEWALMVRNLTKDPRGEQVLAYILSEAMQRTEPQPPEREEGEEIERRPRGGDDRSSRGGDDRRRPRRGHSDHHEHAASSGGGVRDDGPREGRDRDRSHRGKRRGGWRDEPGAAPGDAPRRSTSERSVERQPETELVEARAETPEQARPASRDGAGRADDDHRRRRRGRRGTPDRVEESGGASEATLGAADLRPIESPEVPAPLVAWAEAAPAKTEGLTEATGTGERAAEDAAPTTDLPAEATAILSAVGFEEVQATDTGDGIEDRGPRKRRRRRRRRRRPEDGAETTAETSSEHAEGQDDTDVAEFETASEQPDDGSTSSESSEAGDGRRKRRRRRGRRSGKPQGASSARAPSQSALPSEGNDDHVPQDQIIIDIDEQELEVVRGEFGEIDELDDLTLKGRRRGVIDALQDEVELEDLSMRDSRSEDDDTDEDDDDGENAARSSTDAQDGADATSDAPGGAADGEGSDEDGSNKKRRRRRRGRKKKSEAAPAPELTAPPHKDFWEVWASKFTYQDFEDEVFGAAEPSPDELPERRHDTPEAPPPSAFSASANADNDSDEPFTGVRLNIGRKHGKKAADIRGLLASRLDLAGRAIRNLTVGDASTRLNVSETNAHLMISQLTGYGVDDISLEVSMVDSTPELESNGKDDLEHGAASVAEASEPKPTESVSAEVPPRAPDASDTAAPS